MKWLGAIWVSLIGTAAMAQMTPQEIARFEACVEELYAEEYGTFGAELLVPVICGQQHVNMRPSCGFIERLREPLYCSNRDTLNWLLEVRELSGEGPDWTPVDGSVVWQGLNRCEEISADMERSECRLEVYWREALVWLADPVMLAVQERAAQ